MTSNQYIMKMTPVGSFFFGGENSFGGKTGEETNYFSKSNYLPQQTAVYGLLRYLILINADLLDKSANEKAKLIGTTIPLEEDAQSEKGIIQSISPLFFVDERSEKKQNWLIAGYDRQEYRDKITYEKQKKGSYYLEKELSDFELIGFNYKEEQKLCLYNKKEIVTLDSFYEKHTKVGVRKNNRTKTAKGEDEENFYKQIFLRLKKGISFACTVEFTEVVNFEKSFLSYFGGDQSFFKITFEPYHDVFPKSDKENKGLSKITLLSDTYIDVLKVNVYLKSFDFAINDDIEFRYLKTKLEDNHQKNYALNSNRKKVEKINLLKKGSVFYTSTPQQLSETFKNSAYERLGFNHFLIENI